MDPAENKDNVDAPVMLAYAEPATYAANSRRVWFARRWFHLLSQGALVTVSILAATMIGGMYLPFGPTYPWQASIVLHEATDRSTPPPLQVVRKDRDVVASADWFDQAAKSHPYSDTVFFSLPEIKEHLQVSNVDDEGAFIISIRAEDEIRCDEWLRNCDLALETMRSRPRGWRSMFDVQMHDSTLTDAGKRAPMVSVAGCVSIAVTIVAAILAFAHFSFKRRAIADIA